MSQLINHLLLLAKSYIYCCSINEEPLSISAYQTIVKNKAEIEKQISVGSKSVERLIYGNPLLTNNSEDNVTPVFTLLLLYFIIIRMYVIAL